MRPWVRIALLAAAVAAAFAVAAIAVPHSPAGLRAQFGSGAPSPSRPV